MPAEKGGVAGMYFMGGEKRAFEMLMQQKPGFDRFWSGCAGGDEDCGTIQFSVLMCLAAVH